MAPNAQDLAPGSPACLSVEWRVWRRGIWEYARHEVDRARHNGHADLIPELVDGTTGL